MASIILRLISPAQRIRALYLVSLMAASALTESLGVMLLVPLLAAIDPSNQGAIGRVLAEFGLRLTLGWALALFVMLVVARAVINFGRNTAGLRLEIAVVEALRLRAWRALLRADWRALSQIRRSDSTTVLVTNIDQAGIAIGQASNALAAAATLGGLTIAGLAVAPVVTISGIFGGVLVLFLYRRMRRRAAQLGEWLGSAYATMYGGFSEGLGTLRSIKSLGGEARAEAAAFEGFSKLGQARLAYQRDMGLGQLALQTGGAALLAALVWLAVGRWGLGAAAILPIVALFARALPLMGVLQEGWQNYDHSRPRVVAAFAFIDLAETVREPDLPLAPVPQLCEAITLSGVTVRYVNEGLPALDAVNLTIPAGSVVAVSGSSGAGKSTLADVLGGLISPELGMLLIDGISLDAAQRRAWRSQVAYVHQHPELLANSVRANLLWAAPDASELRLRAALADARAHFVLSWPAGLDTRIGDGGRPLSGGECQRLMLARALLRDPALLILDEATSALDTENEGQVVDSIKQLKGRVAVLVIAHRGALTQLADKTYNLKRGRIMSDHVSQRIDTKAD